MKSDRAIGPSKQPAPSYLDASVQRAFIGADCIVVVVLAALSIYGFIRRGGSAYEWPAVDMACYFERHDDPNFLPHDYFTNSITKSNPRHVFGQFVIALAWVTRQDWYGAYQILRILLTALTPPLWYLALVRLAKLRFSEDRHGLIARLAIGTAIILVMGQNVSAACSIAWWQPMLIYAGPQPLAITLTLGAIVLRLMDRHPARRLSLPLWFAGTLVHPSIGFYLAIFYWLTRLELNKPHEMAAELAAAVVLPFMVLYATFRVDAPLTATEFVHLYAVEGHPFHYQVVEFASMTRYPWWATFLALVGVMAAVGAIASARRQYMLATLAATYVLAYAGCIVVQFVIVDLWPNKILAILGPSRFSFLGFYMAAILVALVACELWPRKFLRNLRSWPSTPPLTRVRRSYAVVAFVGVCAAGVATLDDRLENNRKQFAGLYDWIEQNSDADAVFLTPFRVQLNRDLPIMARRAVFASQCFPFREDAMREHMERVTLAYGTAGPDESGADQIERQIAHYRSLKPEDLLRIAGRTRLDYVIVEPDRADAMPCAPRYRDRDAAVFDIRDLRRVASVQSQTPRTARMPGDKGD